MALSRVSGHRRAVLAGVALLTGCAPPPWPDEAETPDSADTAAADTTPRIDIVYPAPEEDIVACSMVVIEMTNFEIQTYVGFGDEGPPDEDGKGHWHVYWGSTYTGCYTPYCLADFTGMEDGGYVITAELEQNQHEPVLDDAGDPIQDTVAVNLTSGTCEASTAGLP